MKDFFEFRAAPEGDPADKVGDDADDHTTDSLGE